MATISYAKIGTVTSLGPGYTTTFVWNNPPWATVLSYFAYPVPPSAAGPHGTSVGQVAITRVTATYVRDNYNGDSTRAAIEITNTGSATTGFDLYQSWIT